VICCAGGAVILILRALISKQRQFINLVDI
jgi:hypothetical protein